MKPRFQLYHYLIALILVVVTAVTTVLIMQSTQNSSEDESDNGFYIDPNVRDINESTIEINDNFGGHLDYVTISGSEYLFIENGILLASPLLCNTNNRFLIQIAFEYEGQQIYKTGLIPSKKAIADIDFPKQFKPGTYDIKLTYEFFTAINQKSSSTVKVNVKLVVK